MTALTKKITAAERALAVAEAETRAAEAMWQAGLGESGAIGKAWARRDTARRALEALTLERDKPPAQRLAAEAMLARRYGLGASRGYICKVVTAP